MKFIKTESSYERLQGSEMCMPSNSPGHLPHYLAKVLYLDDVFIAAELTSSLRYELGRKICDSVRSPFFTEVTLLKD